MRILIVLSFLVLSHCAFAQSQADKIVDSLIAPIKAKTVIDSENTRIYSLLESFYDEVLQSDNGGLSAKTMRRLKIYRDESHLRNKHLLVLFFMYQDLITDAANKGRNPNPDYQLALIKRLKSEMKSLY